ncbi:uncharacterized protein LOC144877624 [Branchiostoma floridae x Branchiostoma japonicum]
MEVTTLLRTLLCLQTGTVHYFCRLVVAVGTIVWLHAGTVHCLSRGEVAALRTAAVGKGRFYISTGSGPYHVVTGNGVPTHATGRSVWLWPGFHRTPPIKQPHIYRVRRNATFASRPTCLPDGPIGMAVNGVPIYSPYVTDRCYDAGLLHRAGGFDSCSGHVDPQRNYHYHVIPNCLLNQSQVPSAIVGVAFDGFPIYGPRTQDGTTLTSADLDECHGRLVDGRYRYHVTEDFPYFIGCFKGVVMDVKVKMADCKCYGPVNPCNPPQRNAYDLVNIDSTQTQREYRLQINGGRIACKLVNNGNQSASPSPASARNCKISSAMSSVVMVTGLALGTMSLLQR